MPSGASALQQSNILIHKLVFQNLLSVLQPMCRSIKQQSICSERAKKLANNLIKEAPVWRPCLSKMNGIQICNAYQTQSNFPKTSTDQPSEKQADIFIHGLHEIIKT
jgi:hypothetical protein